MIARSRAGYRAFLELALACAASVGAGVSWVHAHRSVEVAPIADGQPVTTSMVYDPQLLLLTLVLVSAAGVLAVAGVARALRARRGPES